MNQQVTRPRELIVYELLDGRISLTTEQKIKMQNLKKGYEGEKLFSELLKEKTNQNFIPLFDVLLEDDGTVFQLDCLLIFQYEMIMLEIKNYYGEFLLKDDYLFSVTAEKRYRNPLHQLQRSNLLLRELFSKHKINLPLTSQIIFVNQEFTLFHAEQHSDLILPTQLNAYLSKLNDKSGSIGNHQYQISNTLLNLQLNKFMDNRMPDYTYSQMMKGILCKTCRGPILIEKRKFYCHYCNKEEGIDAAIMRNIGEFQILFPHKKITVKNIYDWCNEVVSRSTIKRVLVRNMKLNGRSKYSYYTF